MKTFLKFSAVLPLLLFSTACSDKEQPERPLDGEYNVIMTISQQSTRASLPLSEEIKNLQRENLNFATYNADGSLKDFLFQGSTNKANDSVRALYFLPNWGPSVAARLPRKNYNSDFYIACFNIPTILRAKSDTRPFTIAGLDDTAMNLMEWPGSAANSYVWNPELTPNRTLMPMAGITKVTTDYMKKYNELVYGGEHTPFALPDVELTRALAKIVIIDKDNLIARAECVTPKYGTLIPEVAGWLNASTILKPTEPTGVTQSLYTQTLSTPTRTENGVKIYEFYTFERSFYRADGTIAPADADIRKVITLYANASSGLQGGKHNTTPVRIAPYIGGALNTSANLRTFQNGVWQGVMRNTVYTFTVEAPLTGGVQIQVTAADWKDHYTEEFTF